MLNRSSSGTRWRVRPDGQDKVTGQLKYLTDMSAPAMLYGRVLRAAYPHAAIRSVRTERALALPGVEAVLTWKDVPGLNRFGIARADQPVFCEDRVRYTGDAVAAVAAATPEMAEYALRLIEVDYEPLRVLTDPEEALTPGVPQLHPDGNRLHRSEYRRGNVDESFGACVHIVEATYRTPRQMHTYMETEGGLFVPGEDGRLTVYSPTQHGLMDRLQLARILAVPPESIRVVSSPIGGSFGGKDELNVQPYGALLAKATGKPVKIHQSRMESVRAGLKRHPMTIRMKTGVDASGRILAHQVRVLADTGPYATLGAEVLNFTTEHVIGSYTFGTVDAVSDSVFTNNGMSGEFRGFGGNQALFALEGQMDRLAEVLGMDPWEFRRMNLLPPDGTGPFGQPISVTGGALKVWNALKESELWQEREHLPESGDRPPWIQTGIGAAFVMHGAGLGYGIPDPSGGRLRLAHDGKVEAAFGFEECGQGLLATLEQMLVEMYGLDASDLRLVIGDTDAVPDSGSSTASRATSMMWQALRRMREPFTGRLLAAAAEAAGVSAECLQVGTGGVYDIYTRKRVMTYQGLAAVVKEPIRAETSFAYPVSPTTRIGAHYLYSYASVCVRVEVNRLTGRIRLLNQFHAVAAGPVMNPQGYLGQIEGGSGMALGFTLSEDAVMEEGMYKTGNLDTYLIPTASDLACSVEVLPIEDLPEGDEHGPRGIGEIGSVGLAPAIAAAVRQATGIWLEKLPADPALLQDASFLGRKVETV
ncbi:xanthine dehydrogenase D subunit [Paenibacillus rhizosphaerae]|uniref:Xanthine dehydrogenase D subunit n=1 Tax=Paenibacillus rhizosphaerae TaxID=297318 RepID=A0A839TRP0_9BACL|nr:xanthine dehydrogenase subunit D [Paenibacillus rhizosphaerae]MBB3127989.1 xanthine dehydrogenase D subunit [Paenibacillus rhizosphaerae]